MKPIAILGAGLMTLASGTFGAGAYHPPQPPRPPRAPSQPAPDTFKPFKGTHVDSRRGGVNPYPRPAKPKGYISPY